MIINPYLIYFGLQKKDSCPRCYKKTCEKNLEYKPFGEKEPEIYRELTPSKKAIKIFYCPYCGHSLNKEALFCESCGKKLELFS